MVAWRDSNWISVIRFMKAFDDPNTVVPQRIAELTDPNSMSDLRSTAIALFDQCYNDLVPIAEGINRGVADSLVGDLKDVSHAHAEKLHAFVNEEFATPELRNILLGWLKNHPWHREMLLQSSFIAHAFSKPRGYAGDAALMEMICLNDDRGSTPFSVAKNRVYLDLPAATAVRKRARALAKRLERLPEGSRILNLACGPAIEVREFLAKHPHRDVRFLLLDHDPRTINALGNSIHDPRCEIGLVNAFKIIKGKFSFWMPHAKTAGQANTKDFEGWKKWLVPVKYKKCAIPRASFDLVYTSGLYDYIRHTPDNLERGVTGLTAQLFSLVKMGGHLLIGNFRTPGVRDNPHTAHHMTMMDIYSDWQLIYRSDDEIRDFVKTLPRQSHRSTLLNESLNSLGEGGVIGFLEVERLNTAQRGLSERQKDDAGRRPRKLPLLQSTSSSSDHGAAGTIPQPLGWVPSGPRLL